MGNVGGRRGVLGSDILRQEIKGGGGAYVNTQVMVGMCGKIAGLADVRWTQKEEPGSSGGMGGGISRGREWRSRQSRDRNLAVKGESSGRQNCVGGAIRGTRVENLISSREECGKEGGLIFWGLLEGNGVDRRGGI